MKYILGLFLAIMILTLGIWGFVYDFKFSIPEAVTVVYQDSSITGDPNIYLKVMDDVFNSSIQYYWVLQDLKPDEKELAKEILFYQYFETKVKEAPALQENVDKFSKAFRGFYFQAKLSALPNEERRNKEAALPWDDLRAVDGIRELKTDLNFEFYKRINADSQFQTNYEFKICNNQRAKVSGLSFWVSGFGKSSIPQNLKKEPDMASGTEFVVKESVPSKSCIDSSFKGAYKLFNFYEVTKITPLWQ